MQQKLIRGGGLVIVKIGPTVFARGLPPLSPAPSPGIVQTYSGCYPQSVERFHLDDQIRYSRKIPKSDIAGIGTPPPGVALSKHKETTVLPRHTQHSRHAVYVP